METDRENCCKDGINIIIPMGGIGSRFAKHGYRMPKPLIKIAGRSMLQWILSNTVIEPKDTLFLALRHEIDQRYSISDTIRLQFPSVAIITVSLEFATRGAAETLYIVTQYMTDSHLKRRTISLDCDTIYFTDVLTSFRTIPRNSGCSLYFVHNDTEPMYSYISFADDDNKRIIGIAEKVRISRYANTGGYGFGSGTILKKYLVETLNDDIPTAGEYYTSCVIEKMLTAGCDFQGINVPDFFCVGTVPQLKAFLETIRTNRPELNPSQTFRFDLHGILTRYRDQKLTSNLNTKVLMLARSLAAAGHAVTIAIPDGVENVDSLLGMMSIPNATVTMTRPKAVGYHCTNVACSEVDDIEQEIGWYI